MPHALNPESGSLCRVPVTVSTVYRDDVEVPAAKGGENLKLRLTGIDEDDLAAGFVLCSRNAVVPAVTYFNAQLQVTGLILCPSHTTAQIPGHPVHIYIGFRVPKPYTYMHTFTSQSWDL